MSIIEIIVNNKLEGLMLEFIRLFFILTITIGLFLLFNYFLLRFLLRDSFKLPTNEKDYYILKDSKLLLFIAWIYIGLVLIYLSLDSISYTMPIICFIFFGIITVYIVLNMIYYRILFNHQNIIYYNIFGIKKEMKFEEIESIIFSLSLTRIVLKDKNGNRVNCDLTLTGFITFVELLKEKVREEVDLTPLGKVDSFFRFFHLKPKNKD